jgi:SAM-dependent methyltransferase
MERPSWAPPDVDIERPTASRIYDYMLGGSYNFAADREVAKKAIAAMPDLPAVLRGNRAFLGRAVHWLAADAGITQFLDLGSGIPTVGNVHEIAGRVDPAVRVVYVDIDPIAVAHSLAILRGNDNTTAIQADLRRPQAILADPTVAATLDLSRPVAVLLVATLHFLPDSEHPVDILVRLREALPAGSYVAISHATEDGQAVAGQRDAQDIYARSNNAVIMRTYHEIAALLDGWDLVPPGIVRCPVWHPDPGDELGPAAYEFPGYAAVARRP